MVDVVFAFVEVIDRQEKRCVCSACSRGWAVMCFETRKRNANVQERPVGYSVQIMHFGRKTFHLTRIEFGTFR